MISRNDSVTLKGIAIVMVLVGHCVPSFFPFADIYVPIKRVISQVGVELFLIVSGYGIAVSYLTTTCSPVSFFIRRMIKLWPLYALVMVVYYILSIFLLLLKKHA